MTSFHELTEKLKKFNHYNKILAVLDSNDYSLISTTVHEALLAITTFLPRIKNPNPKNEKTSNIYRGMGNDEYGEDNIKDAMHLYNLAALHAPEGSKALAYAYSNRSALYFKMKKFSSSLIDINLCLNIGADTAKLKEKLDKRQEDCYNLLWMESVEHNNALQQFNDSKMAEEFYQVHGKRNPKYPFAKSCLDIIMKDGRETVITTADLKVGEVVSVEPAFVSLGMDVNKWIFCHYCSKYADNLIPCDSCSVALFCNQACKARCWAEFHDIECNIIEICQLLPHWYVNWFRFVIKTWRVVKEDVKKFAEVSKKVDGYLTGTEKATKLDMNNVASYIMPPNPDHIKKYGKLYDTALYTALVIHGLEGIEADVIPKECKKDFIHHVAKQLMFHVMHSMEFSLSSAMQPLNGPIILVSNVESIAVLPFTSRMGHNCDPKLYSVGLGNRMALIVQKPVKAGEELTFSYCGDYHMDSYEERQFTTYNIYGFCCRCQACTENWQDGDCECNEAAKSLLLKLQWADTIKDKYKVLCEIMDKMPPKHNDLTYTLAYTVYRQIMNTFQYAANRQRISGNAGKVELDDDVHTMLDFLGHIGRRH